MDIQTVRLAGSQENYMYRVNRPNIALHTPKAKENAKKKLGMVFAMVGLFAISFSLTYKHFNRLEEEQKELALQNAMQRFIDNNPSRVNVVGFVNGDVDKDKYMVIEYKGKFLGYDKDGNAKYSLPKPHYLYLKKDDYKLKK